jgi:cytochrome b
MPIDSSPPELASAAPATAPSSESAGHSILVWDLPVRVFHWLVALSFAGAWMTAESERWRLLHVTLGYTMAGLIVMRLIWGLIGTRYARFSNFVHEPGVVKRYLGSLLRGQPEHYTGHNPAGGWAIVALLVLPMGIVATGWSNYTHFGGDWLEKAHEAVAKLMLLVVGVHIAGVVTGSWLHRENLVNSMITGRKRGRPEDGVRNAWRGVAIIMLVAVLAFWWVQWRSAPVGAGMAEGHAPVHQRMYDDD